VESRTFTARSVARARAAGADERGIPPDALRDDVERFRDHCAAEGRAFRDWGAATRKWLSNREYGPQARQGAVVTTAEPRRRAPPAGGRQPPRTERNLEAIMRTRGGS
jgi:hypothetical protein